MRSTEPWGAKYGGPHERHTSTAFTMFSANVLVIGPVAYAIGFMGDLLEARQVAAPLTKALLGADIIVLLALVQYFRLHRSIRSSSAETERQPS